MAFKLIALMILTACIAATAKKSDRKVDLYIEDGDNGELRFLGPAKVSQLITNKQNFLEQFRPTTTTGTGAVKPGFGFFKPGFGSLKPGFVKPNVPIIIDGDGVITTPDMNDDTADDSLPGDLNKVTPIYINLGNLGGNDAVGDGGDSNDALQFAAANPPPISQLLPQIVAQAALQQNGVANRRRVPSRRYRPAKRNGNRQVFVIRPSA